MYTQKRLDELSYGYDLDGGGYGFENASYPELDDRSVLEWSQPDLDYVGYYDRSPSDPLPDLILWDVGPCGKPLPDTLTDSDGDTLVRVAQWVTFETDRDCCCHGHLNDPDVVGAAGEGPWVYTGNVMDKPHPHCERCDGDGYVTSDGGHWAAYVRITMTDGGA